MNDSLSILQFIKSAMHEEANYENKLNHLMNIGDGDLINGLENEIFAKSDKYGSAIFFLRDLINAKEYDLAFLILMMADDINNAKKNNYLDKNVDRRAFIYMMA